MFNTDIIPERSTIIVGLSGGPDSIYLLDQLAKLKKSGHITHLIAAHLDHEWRAESSSDVIFCANLAKKYDVPFVFKKISELEQSVSWNGSKEEIGRKARQFFLTSVMKEHKAQAIALGHHADDQQETFFIRLIRGSSLTGLCGMMPKNGPYIRPLLSLSKKDIIDFLNHHKIPYLTDPTNSSQDYLRNRIRANVLPALRACDNRFDHAMLQTISRLQQVEQYMLETAQQLFATIKSDDANGINIELLMSHAPIMQQRLIMLWLIRAHVSFTPTSAFLDEIIKYLRQKAGGKHTLSIHWYIAKKKNIATIVKS